MWGAAVLPVARQDIKEWPIAHSELDEHYKKIFEFMPLSGGEDDYQNKNIAHNTNCQHQAETRSVSNHL